MEVITKYVRWRFANRLRLCGQPNKWPPIAKHNTYSIRRVAGARPLKRARDFEGPFLSGFVWMYKYNSVLLVSDVKSPKENCNHLSGVAETKCISNWIYFPNHAYDVSASIISASANPNIRKRFICMAYSQTPSQPLQPTIRQGIRIHCCFWLMETDSSSWNESLRCGWSRSNDFASPRLVRLWVRLPLVCCFFVDLCLLLPIFIYFWPIVCDSAIHETREAPLERAPIE